MLDHLYTNGLVTIAAICAIIGFSHLGELNRTNKRLVYYIFAALTFVITLQIISLAVVFSYNTPARHLLALRVNISFTLLTLLIILWFFAEYSQVKPRAVLAGITTLIILLFVANLFMPYTLPYKELLGLSELPLPWGEDLAQIKGVFGHGIYLGFLAAILVVFYSLIAVGIAYSHNPRPAYLTMLYALGFLMASFIQGFLFRINILHSPPIAPLCLLAVLVIIGYELRIDRPTDPNVSFRKQQVTRNLLPIFFILLVSISLISWFVLKKSEENLRQEAKLQLSSIVDLKARGLKLWYKERMGDGLILYQNPTIEDLVGRVMKNPLDAQAHKLLEVWFGKYVSAYGQYDQVCLLDNQGLARMCSKGAMLPIDPRISEWATKILQKDQVAFHDFYLSEGSTTIHLGVGIPILNAPPSHTPLGLIFLRINPYAYLYPYIAQWPLPTQTAETFITRREGKSVLFLNETRFKKQGALTYRIPLNQTSSPAVQAILGKEGFVVGTDDQGQKIIAFSQKVPGLPWALIAKMDTKEIDLPMKEKTWQIILLVLALVTAAIIGSGFILREQQIKYYRQKAESENTYRKIFKNIQDTFFQVDTTGKILEASPSVERFIGYRREEVKGRKIVDFYWDPADRALFLKALEEKDEVTDYELRFKNKSGALIYGSTNAHLLRDAEGKPSEICGSVRDITERKRFEAELQSYRNLLEQKVETRTAELRKATEITETANKQLRQQKQEIEENYEKLTKLQILRDSLVHMIVHDLRSPLGALIGFLEILEDSEEKLTKVQQEEIEVCLRVARQMVLTVNGVLDVNKLEAGKMIIHPVQCDIIALGQEVLASLHSLSEGKTLLFSSKDPLSGFLDRELIFRVIQNLLVNALNFAPVSLGRVELRIEKSAEAILFEVIDNGPGIPIEYHEIIFEKYGQVNGGKKRMASTGLGLTFCKMAVEAHGGKIGLISEMGKGSTVWFTIPVNAS